MPLAPGRTVRRPRAAPLAPRRSLRGNTMIRMLSVAIAVSLFAAPVLAVEPPAAPIVLKSPKQGDITFKHETHKAVKCEVCHGPGEPGKMTLDQKKGHAVCQDC